MSATGAAIQVNGLITTEALLEQYRAAFIEKHAAAQTNPKSTQTRDLFENVLRTVISTDDDLLLLNQQPLGMQRRRGCSFVINRHENNTVSPQLLCFMRHRRATDKGGFSLRELERDALKFCKEYLISQNISEIHAMTAVGTRVRLWKCSQESRDTIHCWPRPSEPADDWGYYKDIGLRDDANVVLRNLQEVLRPGRARIEQPRVANNANNTNRRARNNTHIHRHPHRRGRFENLDAEQGDDAEQGEEVVIDVDSSNNDTLTDDDNEYLSGLSVVEPVIERTRLGLRVDFNVHGTSVYTWLEQWDFHSHHGIVVMPAHNVRCTLQEMLSQLIRLIPLPQEHYS